MTTPPDARKRKRRKARYFLWPNGSKSWWIEDIVEARCIAEFWDHALALRVFDMLNQPTRTRR